MVKDQILNINVILYLLQWHAAVFFFVKLLSKNIVKLDVISEGIVGYNPCREKIAPLSAVGETLKRILTIKRIYRNFLTVDTFLNPHVCLKSLLIV